MRSVYYHPEQSGLETVGEVSWGEDYEFDLIVVWRDVASGGFYWAQDAGCSCPTPFEGFSVENEGLKPVESLPVFHAMLLERNAMLVARARSYYRNPDASAQIVDLVTKLHGLGLR